MRKVPCNSHGLLYVRWQWVKTKIEKLQEILLTNQIFSWLKLFFLCIKVMSFVLNSLNFTKIDIIISSKHFPEQRRILMIAYVCTSCKQKGWSLMLSMFQILKLKSKHVHICITYYRVMMSRLVYISHNRFVSIVIEHQFLAKHVTIQV